MNMHSCYRIKRTANCEYKDLVSERDQSYFVKRHALPELWYKQKVLWNWQNPDEWFLNWQHIFTCVWRTVYSVNIRHSHWNYNCAPFLVDLSVFYSHETDFIQDLESSTADVLSLNNSKLDDRRTHVDAVPSNLK